MADAGVGVLVVLDDPIGAPRAGGALDHLGFTPPGKAFAAVEDGRIERVNPSGGLIGAGHPVGATGVRMLHDAARQVTGRAGECHVPGARTAATLNIGGSAATVATFVVNAVD